MKIQDAAIGTKIAFGTYDGADIIWIKASDENDLFCQSECGRKKFDAPEWNGPSRARRNHGNNYFPHSNIFQWLNARGSGWFRIAHGHDMPPNYTGKDGFLSSFTDAELGMLVKREYDVAVPLGSRKEFGRSIKVSSLVTLPSIDELNVGRDDELTTLEGEPMDVILDYIHTARYVSIMTRTGVRDAGHIQAYDGWERCVKPANVYLGVHPMIRVRGDLEIGDEPDIDGFRYPVVDDSDLFEGFFKMIS